MIVCILLFDAYGKKKVRVTGEIYIYISYYIYFFPRFTEGHGKRSINRTSGFNGEAVLSLAVRCNKVASSCKVYTCWFIRNASNFITGCSTCERAAPSLARPPVNKDNCVPATTIRAGEKDRSILNPTTCATRKVILPSLPAVRT